MDRLESVRRIVDNLLRQQPDLEERRCGFVHLYGVASICALLALRRGLDPQLSAAAGMLHDIYAHWTGIIEGHAGPGALEATRILRQAGGFGEAEVEAISAAIARHSDKGKVDGPLDELLKDADVLQHYLYNPALVPVAHVGRLRRVLAELGVMDKPEDT